MSSTALQPIDVSGETLYRLVTLREVQPLEVQPARSSSGYLATIRGRYFNTGAWREIKDAQEARAMGLPGNAFLERMAPESFERAIERFRSGAYLPPRLLFNHGQDGLIGKKPIGVLTTLDSGGAYEAKIFDTSYTRELMPALEDGQFGTSYSFRGKTRGELKRRPKASEHNPKALPEVTVRDIGELKEVSVVTFAADEDTIVQVLGQPLSLAA